MRRNVILFLVIVFTITSIILYFILNYMYNTKSNNQIEPLDTQTRLNVDNQGDISNQEVITVSNSLDFQSEDKVREEPPTLISNKSENTSEIEKIENGSRYIIQFASEEEEIIDFIKKGDMIKSTIVYSFDDELVIGVIEGTEVGAVKGRYADYETLKSEYIEFFSENIIEKEIRKIGLFVFNGKVGRILADGEEFFKVDENSSFEFLDDGIDGKKVLVTIVGEHDTEKKVLYTVKKMKEGVWKIISMDEMQ